MNIDNGPYDNPAHAQAKAAYYAKRRVGTSNSIGRGGNRQRTNYFGDNNTPQFSRNDLGQVYLDTQ
jgi:hypothetical protein